MNHTAFKQEWTVDITDLPDDITDLIWEQNEGSGQNTFTTFYVHGSQKNKEKHTGNEILFEIKNPRGTFIVERGDDVISDWFYDNGFKNREQLLLKLWW